MTTIRSRLGWAVGLVLSGLLLLIWNFDLLAPYEPWTQLLLALLLLVITVGFFSGYLGGSQWWRLIPAWIMSALTTMVLLNTIPAVPPETLPALLFVGIAAGFIHIYLLDRQEHWWALLPAGFTLVIALIIGLSALTHNITYLGAVLFAGMGAVFLAIYLLSPGAQQWWSLIPAGVLLIFGLLILTSERDGQAGYMRWWPLLLVAVGLVIAWYSDSQPRTRPSATTTRTPDIARTKPPMTAAQGEALSTAPKSSNLGDYEKPAPGASVNLLPEREE